MCLREQTLNASPLGRFSPLSFWASKKMGPPEGWAVFSTSALPLRAATGRPYEGVRECVLAAGASPRPTLGGTLA